MVSWHKRNPSGLDTDGLDDVLQSDLSANFDRNLIDALYGILPLPDGHPIRERRLSGSHLSTAGGTLATQLLRRHRRIAAISNQSSMAPYLLTSHQFESRSQMSVIHDYPRIAESKQDLSALCRNWRWFVALGAALIVLGSIALGSLVIVSVATAVAIGALLLVGGVFEVVGAFWSRGWSGFFLHILSGVFSIVIGALFSRAPVDALLALTLLAACLLMVGGILRIFAASYYRFEAWGAAKPRRAGLATCRRCIIGKTMIFHDERSSSDSPDRAPERPRSRIFNRSVCRAIPKRIEAC